MKTNFRSFPNIMEVSVDFGRKQILGKSKGINIWLSNVCKQSIRYQRSEVLISLTVLRTKNFEKEKILVNYNLVYLVVIGDW